MKGANFEMTIMNVTVIPTTTERKPWTTPRVITAQAAGTVEAKFVSTAEQHTSSSAAVGPS